MPRIKSNYHKWSTIASSFLAFIPHSQTFFWSNLNVYFISYLHNCTHVRSGLHSPWVISLKVSAFALAFLLSGYSLNYFKKRTVYCAGTVVSTLSYVLVYWTIKTSFLASILSLGLLQGLGSGLVISVTLQYTVDWADHQEGLFLTIARDGVFFGAIILNLFITKYINPDNQTPDQPVGPTVFFSQPEVIDRVPSLFLILGVFSASCNTIAGFGLKERNDKPDAVTEHTNSAAEPPAELESQPVEGDSTSNRHVQAKLETTNLKIFSNNMTPAQMVRTPQYYMLVFALISGLLSYITINSYSKAFGEVWISDDFALTATTTAIPFVTCITILVWGVFIDKFHVKHSIILFSAGISIFSSVYYFIPLIEPWIFCVTTVLYGGFINPLYAIFTTATVKMFGKVNFAKNHGAVEVSTALFTLISPTLLDVVLINLGWSLLFLFTASISTLALILVVVFL